MNPIIAMVAALFANEPDVRHINRSGLPVDFVTFWKGMVEENDRRAKLALLHLVERWRRWRAGDLTQAIPGYQSCPDPAPDALTPLGWSYSNLIRYMPTDIEIAAATKGRFAASPMPPDSATPLSEN